MSSAGSKVPKQLNFQSVQQPSAPLQSALPAPSHPPRPAACAHPPPAKQPSMGKHAGWQCNMACHKCSRACAAMHCQHRRHVDAPATVPTAPGHGAETLEASPSHLHIVHPAAACRYCVRHLPLQLRCCCGGACHRCLTRCRQRLGDAHAALPVLGCEQRIAAAQRGGEFGSGGLDMRAGAGQQRTV